MTITLRPWDLERDAVRMTEVLNHYGPETITLEGVLDGERRFPKEGMRRRVVATDAADRLVGWSVVVRGPWAPPGRFFVNIKVDPAFCRQGIGSRLCAEAMAFAREQSATELKSEVPEGYEAFALRYGFQIDRHVFESILNVGSFDETPYAGLIETVEASGIRFTSMAEFGADEGARRKLWELELTVARDDPSNTGFNIETPFEDYCKEVFSARWYRADTQLLALDGDRFVGMARPRLV